MMTTYDRKSMTKGLLIGVFAGGALGAGLALLFAPSSGREVRHQIRTGMDGVLRGARNATDRTRSVGHAARAAYRTFREEVRHPVGETTPAATTEY